MMHMLLLPYTLTRVPEEWYEVPWQPAISPIYNKRYKNISLITLFESTVLDITKHGKLTEG